MPSVMLWAGLGWAAGQGFPLRLGQFEDFALSLFSQKLLAELSDLSQGSGPKLPARKVSPATLTPLQLSPFAKRDSSMGGVRGRPAWHTHGRAATRSRGSVLAHGVTWQTLFHQLDGTEASGPGSPALPPTCHGEGRPRSGVPRLR